MYDLKQFAHLITRILVEQELYSKVAVNLLLGTAAVESDFGTYLKQLGGGPGKGSFQMEPTTEADIWNTYLFYGRVAKRKAIYRISGVRSANNNGALEWNLAYAICMCRLHYRRIKEPFPNSDDIEGLAHYWKVYFNTSGGAGTVQQFTKKWNQFIGGNSSYEVT